MLKSSTGRILALLSLVSCSYEYSYYPNGIKRVEELPQVRLSPDQFTFLVSKHNVNGFNSSFPPPPFDENEKLNDIWFVGAECLDIDSTQICVKSKQNALTSKIIVNSRGTIATLEIRQTFLQRLSMLGNYMETYYAFKFAEDTIVLAHTFGLTIIKGSTFCGTFQNPPNYMDYFARSHEGHLLINGVEATTDKNTKPNLWRIYDFKKNCSK